MESIEIIYPDDWHCHLRDDPYLPFTARTVAKYFKRAVVMPNLKPPVVNANDALAYLDRIKSALPDKAHFQPLMTLYLTQQTTPEMVIEAKSQHSNILGFKLYPLGVTTHSQHGISDIGALYKTLETMQSYDVPLLIHGEVNHSDVDIFDREARFIDETFVKLVKDFPQLKMVFEHITTKEAVDFVMANPKMGATITPQHLWLNRNDMLVGGIRPHYYCLPVLKRRVHQEALVKAATSGQAQFFIGTDSAPHAQSQKESACGCAGVFNHHAAISTYVEVFEQENAMAQLERFLSLNGPQFYGLARNTQKMTIKKMPFEMPTKFDYANETIIPFRAGEVLTWQVSDV